MNMILVTYCADDLGMIRKGKVWMAMDSENENLLASYFLLFSCGGDDDDNNNVWRNFIFDLFILMLPVYFLQCHCLHLIFIACFGTRSVY
jgi:hypothetical protein